jgi:DNA modification methylase
MLTPKPKNLINQGNIFQLGNHFLACGDAKDKKLSSKLINKNKIKAIISDPPYSIDYVQSKAGFKQKIAKPKDIIGDQFQSEDDYRKFTKDWLDCALPYLERKNSIYIFNCDKMIFALKQGMEDAGLYFSQLLIWIKSHSVVGRKDYLPQHELIAYGWKGTHDFLKAKDKSVLFAPKPNKSTLHPTMKPVSLLRKIILNCTNINDFIYDSFGGSGSLLIAAEQTKRRCLMIELDPEYCQTIINRFEKLTGIEAKKLN